MTLKEKLEAILRTTSEIESGLEKANVLAESAKGEAENAQSQADEASGYASEAENAASNAMDGISRALSDAQEVSGDIQAIIDNTDTYKSTTSGEHLDGIILNDEDKKEFLRKLGTSMIMKFQRAIDEVIDNVIGEAVNSTFEEIERRVRERGDN